MVIEFLALTIICTPSSCTSSSVVMRADRLLHLQGQYCLPPSPHSCYLELLEACFSSYNIPSSISMHDAPSVASIIPHLHHDLSSERAADTRLPSSPSSHRLLVSSCQTKTSLQTTPFVVYHLSKYCTCQKRGISFRFIN